MILIALAIATLICAIVPAILFVINLKLYVAPQATENAPAHVVVLIPARNEEQNIAACLQHILNSTQAELEVVVLDDASTDRTADIVRNIAIQNKRVRLISSANLPEGWNGKQHACWQLAQSTSSPLLLFLDADVRLHPAAIANCIAEKHRSSVALLSGFPRLITISWLEWLLLPMIHFVLLGFLPLNRMRASTDPAFAAGCGQFMLVDRAAYFTSGGHAAIRSTMHDGLLLPRAFRRAGFHTDLVDITDLAEVRMYDTAAKVWSGLAKNATEGIAAPKRIVPITILLVLGQIVPTLLLATILLTYRSSTPTIAASHPLATIALLLALIASFLPRLLSTRRFKQPLKSALLHPIGIALLLCVQWYALARLIAGKPIGWRQRNYSKSGTEVGK
jgi:glycosyltransferase involved in cell wall biosynthesis